MPAIFVSHSSSDNAAAIDLQERLLARGFRSVFLDFDPARGIPAGRDWQRELYAQLLACQAVIALLSPAATASKWCFAEITQAIAMGKPVFPVKIANCDLDPALAAWQSIDVAAEGPLAYERLWEGLKLQGLDPAASFDWDRSRPPYPGLMAFDERDAAIFFGRDAESQDALERLNRMRNFGGPRMLVVLGPSGSGKSSLMRAGVLPRIRRDADAWLVLDVLRPRTDPLHELAIVLANAFTAAGEPRSRQQVEVLLDGGATFAALARELQRAAGQRDATIVLPLDQMEELFGSPEPDGTQRFLQFIGDALRGTDLPIVVLATLRSDFLGALQRDPVLRGIAFDDVRVGPMTADGIFEVINGPARIAAVTIEPGLTEALLQDTGTDDALPLLAYTLRELYERFGADRTLTLKEYREGLGGLAASIASAAEGIIAADAQLDLHELRSAFARLVRIDEDGHYARRPAAWSEMPQAVCGVLTRFVRARLLVAGGNDTQSTLEVAHEALFRSWERLRAWLDEDKERLLWLQRMRAAAGEWQRSGRDSGALLRGGPLAEAERWLGHGIDNPAEVADYVRASAGHQRAERARIERSRRRTVLALTGGLGAALVFGIFAAVQWLHADEERRIADEQSRIAVARQLGAQAQLLAEDVQSEPVQRALLVAESMRRLPTLQAFVAWTQMQDNMPQLQQVLQHEAEPKSIAWSPNHTLIAAGDEAGFVNVWRTTTGERAFSFVHQRAIGEVEFSPDGALIAAAEESGDAFLWDAASGALRARLPQIDGYGQLTFSPDGALLATVANTRESGPGRSRVFHLWDTRTGELRSSLVHDGDSSTQYMAFSPDGALLATTGPDESVQLWDVASGEPAGYLEEPYGAYTVDFSPDGKLLATGARWNGEIRVWDLQAMSVRHQLQLDDGSFVFAVRFSPDGSRLATGGSAPKSALWDVASGSKLFELETVDHTRRFVFDTDGDRFATVTAGVFVTPGRVRLWDADNGSELARIAPEIASTTIAFGPDDSRIATAGGDDTVRIWSLGAQANAPRFDHGGEVFGAAITPDGARLVSVGGHTAKVWNIDNGESQELLYSNMNAGGAVQAMDLSPDGRLAATGHMDGTVVVWDLETGDRRHLMDDRTVWSVVFSPDGSRLLTASDDNTVRLWDVGDGRELLRVVHDDSVGSAVFSPDGTRFASASNDKSVRVWDADTGQQILRLEHPYEIWDVQYSPDGTRLAALAPEDAALQIWDATTGRREVSITHDDLIYSFEFSPNGRWIASASRDRSVAIRDAATGADVLRLVHNGPASGARFSPDSRWIVTWDAWSGPARIWELATGTEVARFADAGDAGFVDAGFSPDGSRILTAREDGVLQLRTWQAQDIVADVCSRVTRNLTEDEWRRFVGDEPYRPTCP